MHLYVEQMMVYPYSKYLEHPDLTVITQNKINESKDFHLSSREKHILGVVFAQQEWIYEVET